MNTDDEIINDWQGEAEAIINDVQSHVKEICISSKIPLTENDIHLNITTLEERKICVRLSSSGFEIVGETYDEIGEESVHHTEIYETPYALLQQISPLYIASFGNSLVNALNKIKDGEN